MGLDNIGRKFDRAIRMDGRIAFQIPNSRQNITFGFNFNI